MSVFFAEQGSTPDTLLKVLQEGFTLKVVRTSKEILTYRDTFDWRLHSGGRTLTTARAGRRIRVCLSARGGEETEISLSRIPLFASDLPPSPMRTCVEPLIGVRRLLPRAHVEWEGTLAAVVNEDGKTVLRLRLRTGEATLHHGGPKTPISPRLEILPLKGYGAEEREFREYLENRGGLRRRSQTEAETAYAAVGQTPGDYSSSFSLALSRELSACEAARRINWELLKTINANREGVTRNWDTEFLHDFRVAVRRTRSAISQLPCVFPETETEHFSREFRWLGKKTGTARDIDVYLLKIPTYRAALHPRAEKNLEPLVRLLKEKKKVENRRLRNCFTSKRFNRLLDDWEEFLADPCTEDPSLVNAGRPILDVASERIFRAFKKVMKRGENIQRDSSARALHKFRLDCKKLRYLLTFFRSLYPSEAINPLVREVKRLQDRLGDFNDLQVQQDALRAFAEELMATRAGPPATLLAMGQLMGQLEGAQAQERERFQEYFKEFSRPKVQRSFEKLFGPEGAAAGLSGRGKKNR